MPSAADLEGVLVSWSLDKSVLAEPLSCVFLCFLVPSSHPISLPPTQLITKQKYCTVQVLPAGL